MADITTNNLSFNEVVQGTSNEAAQVNDALGNFDAFHTAVLEVDLTSGSYTLATDPPEFKRYRKYRVINATSGSPADTFTVQAISRFFYVDTTDASNTESIVVSLGSTDITQAIGIIRLYETDGTANGLALVDLGGEGGGGGGAWELAGAGQTATGIWNHSVDGDKANVDFTGLAGATDIMIIVRLVTKQTTGVFVPHLSVDNGAAFNNTATDYIAIVAAGTEATGLMFMHSTDATAARSCVLMISGANVNGAPKRMEALSRATVDGAGRLFIGGSLAPVNAVRIVGDDGGNLTGGAIYCLARF